MIYLWLGIAIGANVAAMFINLALSVRALRTIKHYQRELSVLRQAQSQPPILRYL